MLFLLCCHFCLVVVISEIEIALVLLFYSYFSFCWNCFDFLDLVVEFEFVVEFAEFVVVVVVVEFASRMRIEFVC